MTTRERIIDEALTLFSQRGFEGVTVKEIAQAVGIKDSSLYKHFPSKQAIFGEIIDQMEIRLNQMHAVLQVPDARRQDVSNFFSRQSSQSMTEMVEQMFIFYLRDPIVGRIRRLFTIEQFGNSTIAQQYGSLFIESALDYHVQVFSQMIASGAFLAGDPNLMALQFYSPIFLLLSKVDLHPETENEAILLLNQHVMDFGTRHGNREGAPTVSSEMENI